jgi:DNA-binding CsgD family transcriptional regulator
VPLVTRLRHRYAIRYVLMARAALFAHRGRRSDMTRVLAEFARWGGRESHQQPLVHGLCEAFCALLEEDRALALRALDQAIECEAENPTNYVLAGQYGLRVLLGVLDDELGWPDHDAAASVSAGDLAWNRQFLHLAQAVLLGREGRSDAAEAVMERHREVAAPFGMARYLGLRLVAEAALADGWGDPACWLREAQAYFHVGDVPAVANACRVLLRQAGVIVNQYRTGRDGVPTSLRVLGITVREYEVLRLLAERLGNTEIGRRLYISPRTVEKHVASLLAKSGQTDRAALCQFAISQVG